MTSKGFFIRMSVFFFLIAFLIIGVNYYFDDFGLFRSHSERRIWAREKTSKYLMSYKYIPENYDAVLVGSSVSANMDTRKLSGYKVYNLSMNSGNITELKYPLDVLIESGKIKAVIFCLYDYTTKDSGLKGNQLSRKEYWGSLYSTIPFDVMKYKIKLSLGRGNDVFKFSQNGFNNFNITKTNVKFHNINEKYMENPRNELIIDSTAFEELKETIDSLHNRNIKIYGFFYPIYKEWFKVFEKDGEWAEYKNKILSVFDDHKDVIIDMNTEDYDYISNSKESYTDGHLSDKGAEAVLKTINSLIKH